MNKSQLFTPAIVLGLFALVCTSLLALVHHHTKEQIAINQRNIILDALNSIIPKDRYDNDLLNDTTFLYSLPELGSHEGIRAYRARKNNQPVAVIFSPIAPDGYNGNIKLLIGINYDGTVAGVRVVEHHETPGLGDAIELKKSNWSLSFNDKSLSNPAIEQWAVKPDGGNFDAFTGATITPRAIVNAILHALQYYQKEKDAIFAQN